VRTEEELKWTVAKRKSRVRGDKTIIVTRKMEHWRVARIEGVYWLWW
jgi:hypothetical protein